MASNFKPNFLAAYNSPPVRSPNSLKTARLESNNSSLPTVTSFPWNSPESYLNLLVSLTVLVAGLPNILGSIFGNVLGGGMFGGRNSMRIMGGNVDDSYQKIQDKQNEYLWLV